ncbi:MAG: CDP-diacylglycerol--glycerol-3-phosphate 3-phosphatidyltransferase [Candidatus Omnitrophica bacterium]|nr:CDP-diacylglycerol--glycerol-3-phosphate 3-phosphatidyltransferase [Candidatus Omnitrophota bacterium]
MSLPNQLTISRILLTLVFIGFLFQPGVGAKIIAVVVFLLAIATDFCDGYYAKKYNLVSNFGKMMDPVADKFLVLTAFFVFASMHMIALWMFVTICAREVAVTLVRLYAMKRGKVLAAEQAGKVKTALQFSAILIILFFLILAETVSPGHWSKALVVPLFQGISVLMFVVVAVTLFSGISFLWNNRRAVYAQ